MNVTAINNFFNYQNYYDSNPQDLVDSIIEQAHAYGETNKEAIQYAYEYARDAHEWQVRLSWEPYIIHPVRATLFLMHIKPDLATIQTCLLHDVIEDTPITYEDVARDFGKEVADLCEWLNKVSKIRYKGEERDIETLKKTFLAMAQDLRVIFVKLADRIHNIQTLRFHPKEEKQRKIAIETMKIYVPIAKKLWLYQFQSLLENGAFKILHPLDFERVFKFINRHFKEAENYIETGKKLLRDLLTQEGHKNFSIKGRLKSPYRIREKLQNKYQTRDLTKVMDTLAFRIIVDSIPECYSALWVIHASYRPLIHRIKDYIAVPKFNNYQSIHTTVFGMFQFPTEIQIRTKEMDIIAEYGVAAHFAYSSRDDNFPITKKQWEWIQKLQNTVKAYQEWEGHEEFKKDLSIDLLNKNIFVYTPQGQIIELSQWSSVLDFAFKVHSDVWLRFKHAIVNDVIKPIGYKPQMGDVISIKTFRNKYVATREWTEYLQSWSAKAKLNKFLKQKHKDEYITRGKRTLNEMLDRYNLPRIGDEWDKMFHDLSDQEREDVFIEISDKQTSPVRLIRQYYPDMQSFTDNKKETTPSSQNNHLTTTRAIIGWYEYLNYELCPECNPTSQDKIIAKSGKNGLKIHTLRCKALKTLSFDKMIEAHRKDQWDNEYTISLTLTMPNKPGNIARIMSTFSDMNIDIDTIQIANTHTWSFSVSFLSSNNHPTKIGYLIKTLQKQFGFIKIVKRSLH